MRKYELTTIFPVDEELYKTTLDSVKQVLSEFGAEVESEESLGDRNLYYMIKKRNKGRFLLLNIKVNPAKVVEIEKKFKLIDSLLKYMFVRVDE
ncbi:MAG TPA: 30S ribosomal protein S6 [Treponemataceae bacterium]|nr:30S ribosomal protein S6 [Flavobacterium sp.]HUH44089.1 30S ribosomal protein S6 [Treponemataceae bacterium]